MNDVVQIENLRKRINKDLLEKGYCIMSGDSIDLIPLLPNKSIQLVYGSPPYPNAKRNYRTWKIENYISEISPFLFKLLPKIKDTGFIVINIKANRTHPQKDISSERSLVVEELMLFLKKKLNLFCVDIEIWVKTNPVPTGLRVACQDSYEYNLWFSKAPKWNIDIDSIRRPYSEATLKTYGMSTFKPRKNGLQYVSKEKTIDPNILGALPVNVLTGAVSSKSINHQAVQPEYISEKYIKACTKEGDIVFDPWVGSGTTGVVSVKTKRRFIGFDISEVFSKLAIDNVDSSRK